MLMININFISEKEKSILDDNLEFTVGCEECVEPMDHKWKFCSSPCPSMPCPGTFLLARKSGDGVWAKIRRRRECEQSYKLCGNFPNSPCPGGKPSRCPFAHSEEERNVWNAEKSGNFNIQALKTELQLDKAEETIEQQEQPHDIPSSPIMQKKFHETVKQNLTKENYVSEMHKLLYLEETFQSEMISK